jgi:hypothetical protein
VKGEAMGKGSKYLCDWKKGDIADNLTAFKKIVAKPKYLCLKCGRVAKDADYLHKPESLEE